MPKETLEGYCYLSDPALLTPRLIRHVFSQEGKPIIGGLEVSTAVGLFQIVGLEFEGESETGGAAGAAIDELRALVGEAIEAAEIRDYANDRIDNVRTVLSVRCEYETRDEQKVLELVLELNATVAGLLEIWDEVFDFNGEPLSLAGGDE
jgi:hypothetical protein